MTVETKRDFNADRAICDAATAGPWYLYDTRLGKGHIYASIDGVLTMLAENVQFDNAKFCAEARTGWPDALDEIERLRGVLERFDARTHPMLSRTDMARIAGEALDGDATRSTYFELRKLRAETQRYRQALEYIAKANIVDHGHTYYSLYIAMSDKAKEALKHGEAEN